ncbi:hypothetical protein OKW32_000418 [Paraburkholderia youngii]
MQSAVCHGSSAIGTAEGKQATEATDWISEDPQRFAANCVRMVPHG